MDQISNNLPNIVQNNSFKVSALKPLKWSLVSTLDKYFNKKIDSFSWMIDEVRWKNRLQNAGVPKADEILTYTRQYELRVLYNLASALPQGAVALEIGSHLGASSCYIAAGLTKVNGHLFCIDTWNNETMIEGKQDTFSQFKNNTDGVKQFITPIRKRSDEISKSDIRVPLNFIFIDGDHSYASVKSDFELVQQWLLEDGIIAFHDFSTPAFEGVTRLIGEALASGHWMMLGQAISLVWLKRSTWFQPTWLSGH